MNRVRQLVNRAGQTLSVLAFAALFVVSVSAQDLRPLAIVNARILTLTGGGDDAVVESGTVLVRNGTIDEVGADVEVPPGAKVVDANGGTVMPGLVHAFSRAGLTAAQRALPSNIPERFRSRFRGRGRRGGSSGAAANKAANKIGDTIYARQDVFGELLAAGVTTLVVRPQGAGFPGQSTMVDLSATEQDGIVLDDDTYLLVTPAAKEKTKKLLKDSLDAAKKVLEERKKPKPKPEEKPKAEDEKKAGDDAKKGEDEKKTPKPDEKTPPKPEPKPTPKPDEKTPQDAKKAAAKPSESRKRPAKKKDPNAEVLADLLDGKRKAFLQLDSAADMLHYLDAIEDHEFKATIVAANPSSTRGRLDQVLDHLKKFETPVLMRPGLSTLPYTATLVNTPATLNEAGIEVGFVLPDSPRGVRSTMFELIELVRHGLPADVALRGVTAVPAKALGIDADVGTIETGKTANLLLFSHDPLDPTSELVHVFYRGKAVEESDR